MDDVQLVAEHDLRTAQDQESQNVATALKHMEAYCLGTNVNPSEHTHAVSEEDFKKLDRQRLIQQNLPTRLQSAINVLRARQERETKRKLRKQEEELKAMDEASKKQRAAREVECSQELERLETVIQARRRRVMQRWDLKLEMWRRDWEEQQRAQLTARLEHESWPPSKTQNALPIPESSGLAQYVKAAA